MTTRPAADPPSERVRLRRKRERGRYEREVIEAILDEALIAHLGISGEDGQPFVIPTLHARAGGVVYCHGSLGSRTIKALSAGAPACLTVSLIDGLVLARSAMHHSANYRSVVLLGQARVLSEPGEKRAALEAVVEHIVPGRWRGGARADRQRAGGHRGRVVPDRGGLGEDPHAAARSTTSPTSSCRCGPGVLPLTSSPGTPQPDAAARPRDRAALIPESLPAPRRRVTP